MASVPFRIRHISVGKRRGKCARGFSRVKTAYRPQTAHIKTQTPPSPSPRPQPPRQSADFINFTRRARAQCAIMPGVDKIHWLDQSAEAAWGLAAFGAFEYYMYPVAHF